MLEISQQIGINIDKIFVLRSHSEYSAADNDTNGALTGLGKRATKRRTSDGVSGHSRISKRRSIMRCSACATRHTPKWRNGPDGLGTLCNVCGLIYAKRLNKHLARWAADYSLGTYCARQGGSMVQTWVDTAAEGMENLARRV